MEVRKIVVSANNEKAIAFFKKLREAKEAAIERMLERTAHIREKIIADLKAEGKI